MFLVWKISHDCIVLTAALSPWVVVSYAKTLQQVFHLRCYEISNHFVSDEQGCNYCRSYQPLNLSILVLSLSLKVLNIQVQSRREVFIENLAAIKQKIKIKDSKQKGREQEKENNKNRITKAEAGRPSVNRRCGSVYLGVVVLSVCEVCYVYEGYVGSAVVLYI